MKSLGNRDKNKFTIQKPLTWYQLVKPPNSIQDFEYQSPNLHRLLQIPRLPDTLLGGPQVTSGRQGRTSK